MKRNKDQYGDTIPTIIEAIEFRMEQYGHNRKDLVKLLGSDSHTSEMMSGKRNFGLTAIKKLYKYGIPASVLLQEDLNEH